MSQLQVASRSSAVSSFPPRLRENRASSTIDVSVCIANWNCRDLLRDCLRSLLRQPQGVPLEVIVVDNASGDGAPEMAAEEFPEVVLIRNDRNRGFGERRHVIPDS